MKKPQGGRDRIQIIVYKGPILVPQLFTPFNCWKFNPNSFRLYYRIKEVTYLMHWDWMRVKTIIKQMHTSLLIQHVWDVSLLLQNDSLSKQKELSHDIFQRNYITTSVLIIFSKEVYVIWMLMMCSILSCQWTMMCMLEVVSVLSLMWGIHTSIYAVSYTCIYTIQWQGE